MHNAENTYEEDLSQLSPVGVFMVMPISEGDSSIAVLSKEPGRFEKMTFLEGRAAIWDSIWTPCLPWLMNFKLNSVSSIYNLKVVRFFFFSKSMRQILARRPNSLSVVSKQLG